MRASTSTLALTLAAALGAAPVAVAQAVPEMPAAARANPANWPTASSPAAMSDAATEAFVTALMARMTVEEKVGQTIQADIGSISPQDLLTYPLGSILAGGNSGPGGEERGDPMGWVHLAREFRAAVAARPGAQVPLIFGIDAVHGHNNVVGATIFPHNIGLGAARNPELIRRIAEVTALEVAATGADWTFGPTLAVPRDDRWGRTYEGYAEDPEIQRLYAGPITLGLQGELPAEGAIAPGRIAGSAKHYLADGGTEGGRDQGDYVGDEQGLIDIHLGGYIQSIDAGVLSVMASFSSWNGVKHSGNPTLLRDILHGPLGFDGFVVSDWNAHGQLPGCTNESCALAFNAGIDMFMAPDSWRPLYENTLAQVRSGEISMARLDEAVRRILRAKVKAGVFRAERPYEGRMDLLGAPAHRALARQAVRESLVLLKNDGVLPVRSSARVLVAGAAADDIGQASGGWTLSWQGTGNTNADFPNGQSIWAGIAEAVSAGGGQATLSPDGSFETRPDVAIVVFGEQPYAEFLGDLRTVDFVPEEPLETLRRLQAAGIPTVSVFLSGRPMWTNPEINASNAFVAAWLPGTEGGGLADVLVGDAAGAPRHDFRGTLSFSWPKDATGAPLNRGEPGYDPLFAYGYGLSYAAPGAVGTLSEDSGVTSAAGGADAYLVNGRIPSPWSLILADEGGQQRLGEDISRGASPRNGVTVAPVDDRAQESARQFVFRGPATVSVWGPAVDLRREVNGDMALGFRYRIDAAPAGRLTLGYGQARWDATDVLTAGEAGQWAEYSVRLGCFAREPSQAVETPFSLTVDGPATISLSEVRLVPGVGPRTCPAE